MAQSVAATASRHNPSTERRGLVSNLVRSAGPLHTEGVVSVVCERTRDSGHRRVTNQARALARLGRTLWAGRRDVSDSP